jgi:hypothetical protein
VPRDPPLAIIASSATALPKHPTVPALPAVPQTEPKDAAVPIDPRQLKPWLVSAPNPAGPPPCILCPAKPLAWVAIGPQGMVAQRAVEQGIVAMPPGPAPCWLEPPTVL